MPKAVLVVAALAFGGCRESDTVLAVTVVGNQTELRQLDVEVSIDDARRTFAVPPDPGPIALPATFTIRVDRGQQGELTVHVDGLDARGARVADGEERLPSFRVGAVNGVEVRLHDVILGGADGGADVGVPPPDASEPRDAGAPDAARPDARDAAGDALDVSDALGVRG